MSSYCLRTVLTSTVLLTLLCPAAWAKPPELRQARRLFYKGNKQYRLANFQKALELFKQSLAKAERPNTIFNIAQCHRQLKQPEKALFNYKLYLSEWERQKPGTQARHHGEAQEHIAALEAELEQKRQAEALEQKRLAEEERKREAKLRQERELQENQQALAARATEPPPPAPRRRRLWTWIALGSAAAVAGVGLGLYLSADSDYDEYQNTQDPDRLLELESSIGTRDTAAVVMYATAGALAVTSVVLFFLEGRASAEKPQDTSSALFWPRLSPGRGAALGFSF
jgi:tetratricopeptide (TPR) repeat protein